MHHNLEKLLAPNKALLEAVPPTITEDEEGNTVQGEALPCGPLLEYDPLFVNLFFKMTPKTIEVVENDQLKFKQEPIRWGEIEKDCRELLLRTHDIRVLVIFTRCRTQQAQWQGLMEGLALLLAMLRNWPQELHPALLQDGELDPQVRANALSELAAHEGLLNDIRGLPLHDGGRMRVQVRDLERAIAQPHPDHVLPPEGVRRMLAEMKQKECPDYMALLDVLCLLTELEELVRHDLGEWLSLDPLLNLLQKLNPKDTEEFPASPSAEAMQDNQNEQSTAEAEKNTTTIEISSPHAGPAPTPTNHTIPHRQEARERIRQVRLWFEQHEPSSPVALLLRKAEGLVGKRFAEVVDTLPPELLARWDEEQ